MTAPTFALWTLAGALALGWAVRPLVALSGALLGAWPPDGSRPW